MLDYNAMRVARIPRLPRGRRAPRPTARRAPSRAARAQAGASGHGCCSSSRGAWCNCINISHATALFTGHVADAIFTALSFVRPSRTLPGSNRAFFYRPRGRVRRGGRAVRRTNRNGFRNLIRLSESHSLLRFALSSNFFAWTKGG
ncbi:hypothetical protein C6Q09_10260 [Burkholderia multivorans]|nr:hypothetical protein C6Q09_10260 [Burkholderia multivorans]